MAADPFAGGDSVLPISRAAVFFDGQYSEPRIHHPEGSRRRTRRHYLVRQWRGRHPAHRAGWLAGQENRLDRRLLSRPRFRRRRGISSSATSEARRSGGSISRRARSPASPRPASSSPTIPSSTPRAAVSTSLTVSEPASADRACGATTSSTGSGGLWWAEPMNFANGMALSSDGSALFVVETLRSQGEPHRDRAGRQSQSAGLTTPLTFPALPDGLAVDDAGKLYVSCYEPSRILRVDPRGKVEIYIEDVTAHVLLPPDQYRLRRR